MAINPFQAKLSGKVIFFLTLIPFFQIAINSYCLVCSFIFKKKIFSSLDIIISDDDLMKSENALRSIMTGVNIFRDGLSKIINAANEFSLIMIVVFLVAILTLEKKKNFFMCLALSALSYAVSFLFEKNITILVEETSIDSVSKKIEKMFYYYQAEIALHILIGLFIIVILVSLYKKLKTEIQKTKSTSPPQDCEA